MDMSLTMGACNIYMLPIHSKGENVKKFYHGNNILRRL